MTATAQLDPRTVEMFAGVTRDLQVAFDRLADRAQVVEDELASTNRLLAAKVSELDELHADLATLLAALPCGVLVRDSLGRTVARNPAAAELLDCEPGDEFAALERIGIDGQSAQRVRFRTRAGRPRVLAASRAELPEREGSEPGEVLLLDDQTDQEELLRTVASRNKMAAIGTLSAGLAHEIRNPLNAVVGFASLLAKSQPEGSQARHWSNQILAGALETNRILTGLVDFARPGELAPQTIDAAELLDETCELVLGEGLRGTPPVFELDAAGLTLVGDRLKLRQALRNLIQNALDASDGAPRVRVEVRRDENGTCISVEDAGPGVSEDLRESLFEPFATGRASGTGLGLALTHAIAELHGGEVRCSPDPSSLGGARFELRLPPEGVTSPLPHLP